MSNFKVRLLNKLFLFLPMSRMHSVKAFILRAAGLKIGVGVRVWSTAKFYSPYVEIGDNTFVGFNVQFFADKQGPIKIGKNCAIGADVIIVTGSHLPGTRMNRTGQGIFKPITIGDGVRISTRALIIEGVSVGDGAQIAAGSVVIRDVSPNTLVGGGARESIKGL